MSTQISPELQTIIARYQHQANQITERIEPFINELRRVTENLRPYLELAAQIVQSPVFKYQLFIHNHGIIPHPVLNSLLDSEFTIDNLENNWEEMKNWLYEHMPDSLDKDHRKERYRQILECQTIGAYIPVCRAVYAEIEALLRDEILSGDKNTFKQLTRNQHPNIKLIDEEATIDEVGWHTCCFLKHLEEAFENFDPAKAENPETKSYRHIHAHGWAKKASFIDGLNGILAFDLAMGLVAKNIEERDEGILNNEY